MNSNVIVKARARYLLFGTALRYNCKQLLKKQGSSIVLTGLVDYPV